MRLCNILQSYELQRMLIVMMCSGAVGWWILKQHTLFPISSFAVDSHIKKCYLNLYGVVMITNYDA